MRTLKLAIAVFLASTALACVAAPKVYQSDQAEFIVEPVVSGLENPWGIAFLPDGTQLVTERTGRLRVIRDGKLVETPVSGVPKVATAGQGGLLDITLHPGFSNNRRLFLSYVDRNSEGLATRVDQAEYRDGALTNRKTVFEAKPRSGTGRHFGGRMLISDGYLYVSVGDRGERQRAQDTTDDAGGIHRITISGEVPEDNPFREQEGASPTLYTMGNRNVQGLAEGPRTGRIWSHEHGPQGGDEINIVRAGTNYGWPEITYGINYDGSPITDQTEKEGMAQPLHYWDPSIAPSGMTFYTGNDFPEWQGDLFVGALKMQKLVRLEIEDGRVTEEEDLIREFGQRIRTVTMGPDGHLWLLTDATEGQVVKIIPAQ